MAIVLIAGPLALQACSKPTAPPEPPSGGHTLSLDFATFAAEIEPILTARGCDAGGDCHGGGIRGSLELSPAGAKDAQFDYAQVSLQVSAAEPEASPILTEPLATAAGGTPHPVEPFATTGDPDYQTIRAWVLAGVPR